MGRLSVVAGDRGQWVLSESDREDRLDLESIKIEVAVADLYRQVKLDRTAQ